MPAWARDLPVLPTTPEAVQVPLAFSGLPADVARDTEPLFAQAGTGVCSNASSYRRDPDVPILLPEINACHAEIIPIQRRNAVERFHRHQPQLHQHRHDRGANAASLRLRRVFAVCRRALSGAGYPGVVRWTSPTTSSFVGGRR
jgi:aspartate-semialdehyde dehydrogenase